MFSIIKSIVNVLLSQTKSFLRDNYSATIAILIILCSVNVGLTAYREQKLKAKLVRLQEEIRIEKIKLSTEKKKKVIKKNRFKREKQPINIVEVEKKINELIDSF